MDLCYTANVPRRLWLCVILFGCELIGVVWVCLYILCALWWICVVNSHWWQCVLAYECVSVCSHRVKSSSSSLFCRSCLGWVMLAQLGRDCSRRLMSSSLAQDALMVSFSSHCTIPLQHTQTHTTQQSYNHFRIQIWQHRKLWAIFISNKMKSYESN